MGCCANKGDIDPNAPEWMEKKWSHERLKQDWKTLKAGDILLVTYRKGHPNRLIGKSQGSFWDHIGIVVHGFDRSSWHDRIDRWDHNSVDCMDARRAGPQVLESTGAGVHIYNLLERVSDPEGYKYHRICYSLRRLVGVRRNREFYKVVESLCRDTLGKKYSSITNLLSTVLRSHAANDSQPCVVTAGRNEMKTVHCSQLCALMYQRLGLMSRQYASRNFFPSDFSSTSEGKYKVDFLMAKVSNAKLTKEELLFYEGQHEEHDKARLFAKRNKVVPSKSKVSPQKQQIMKRKSTFVINRVVEQPRKKMSKKEWQIKRKKSKVKFKFGDWEKLYDEEVQSDYYHNTVTGESQWEQPDEFPLKKISKQEWKIKRKKSKVKFKFGDWEKLYDEEVQSDYYYNTVTGESQWEKPDEYIEDVELHMP